jgi:hypothetical protein
MSKIDEFLRLKDVQRQVGTAIDNLPLGVVEVVNTTPRSINFRLTFDGPIPPDDLGRLIAKAAHLGRVGLLQTVRTLIAAEVEAARLAAREEAEAVLTVTSVTE